MASRCRLPLQADLEASAAASVRVQFESIAVAHLKAVLAVATGDAAAASAAQQTCLEKFLNVLQEPDSAWMLPALRTIMLDSRVFVDKAEAVSARRGDGHTGEARVSCVATKT